MSEQIFDCYLFVFSISVLWDPVAFLSFVGADQVVTEQSKDTDTAGLNRGRVSVWVWIKWISV